MMMSHISQSPKSRDLTIYAVFKLKYKIPVIVEKILEIKTKIQKKELTLLLRLITKSQ